jgi:hypothetical protein
VLVDTDRAGFEAGVSPLQPDAANDATSRRTAMRNNV